MNNKIIGFLFLIGMIITGCSTRDYFGELSDKEMLLFQLEGQTGSTQMKGDTIYVKVTDDVYLTSLTNLSASNIKVSDYATFTPAIGDKQDFTNPVEYIVQAEDGSTKIYYVVVELAGSSQAQIPNNNFNLWHTATYSNYKYDEIGENEEDKTWGTGNKGAIFALRGDKSKLPTKPYEIDTNNFAAELTTTDMGILGLVASKGIAAGNLFTGKFEFIGNITNARPVFGIPYTQTPIAFQVDYKYSPAEGLKDGKLDPVEGKDKMDMYIILEKREGDKVKRLGVGWYRSGEEQKEWKTQEVEIKYAQGKAPDGIDEHAKHVLKYGHDGNPTETDPTKMPEATWGNIATDKPTHILVVFTSSYQGDYFIGAPGSKLIVDNFKLIY